MGKFFWFCILLSVHGPIKASETLRVVTEELPPYQIVKDGQLIGGSSYRVVQEMLKRSQYKSRIEVLPWARAYSIASTEPNVVIFSMARNQNRESNFHWLLNVDALRYHFYTLSSQNDIHVNNLTDALSHIAVTVRDSYEAHALLKMGFVEGINLVLTRDYIDAWRMLSLGRADVTYASHVIETLITDPQSGEPASFSKQFSIGDISELYIAASITTEPDILEKLRTTLRSMVQDGTIEKLIPIRN